MLSRFLLPDGEVSDGVRAVRPDLEFSTFSEAMSASDLSPVEFYVIPYLGGPPTIDILTRLPGLRVVQLLTAGVDWILPSIPPGVLLCRAGGVHEASVAELVLGGILAMSKDIPTFVQLQAKSEWGHRRVGGILGLRAIVLGYGAIGKATADRLAAFGVEVIGISRSGRPPTQPLAALPELLPSCDILIVLLPLTDETEGLVDAAMLRLLSDGALIVSAGRGAVVDNVALEAELASGRLRAVLDVMVPEPLPPDSRLWRMRNVLITPHVGGDTDLFPGLASKLVVAQMVRYLEGSVLEHQVTSKY